MCVYTYILLLIIYIKVMLHLYQELIDKIYQNNSNLEKLIEYKEIGGTHSTRNGMYSHCAANISAIPVFYEKLPKNCEE